MGEQSPFKLSTMKLQETNIKKLYDFKRKDIQKHFEKLQKKAKKMGVHF